MGDLIPAWIWEALGTPGRGAPLHRAGDAVVDGAGQSWGTVDDGIICFPTPPDDPSIAYYRSLDGAHFHERSRIPYTMANLDTAVYRAYLERVAPADRDTLIVDVGGGDGRNTLPWLEWGYR